MLLWPKTRHFFVIYSYWQLYHYKLGLLSTAVLATCPNIHYVPRKFFTQPLRYYTMLDHHTLTSRYSQLQIGGNRLESLDRYCCSCGGRFIDSQFRLRKSNIDHYRWKNTVLYVRQPLSHFDQPACFARKTWLVLPLYIMHSFNRHKTLLLNVNWKWSVKLMWSCHVCRNKSMYNSTMV